MKPIRLLLADDLMLIRHGIRALLSSVEDVDIVGEVSTADDAVRLARELVPDVVLMDQDMPGDGLAATRSIKEQLPDIEIIVMTDRPFSHPEIPRKLMERLVSLSREQRTRMRLESEGLTPRELDILMELAKGSTDREIAAKFVVAEGTVKTHIRHLLRKLGARNRTQAVAYVLRKGVIQ